MVKYKCEFSGKEFSEEQFQESIFCPENDGYMLVPVRETVIEEVSKTPAEGKCGLGILVLDFSSSMNESAFSIQKDSKIGVVKNALGKTLVDFTGIKDSKNAYIAIIGFAKNAELLGIYRASELKKDINYWKGWIEEKRNKILGEKMEDGTWKNDGTNIKDALMLAREIYDAALNGEMDKYGINDFSMYYQDIAVISEKDLQKIANLRVFIYSDGEHNIGLFPSSDNPFKGASLIPGKTNVSGLITAYFGQPNTKGYKLLEDIAGSCPRHNSAGVMCIDSPEAYPYVRKTFRMTSHTSGFCLECAKGAREPQ